MARRQIVLTLTTTDCDDMAGTHIVDVTAVSYSKNGKTATFEIQSTIDDPKEYFEQLRRYFVKELGEELK